MSGSNVSENLTFKECLLECKSNGLISCESCDACDNCHDSCVVCGEKGCLSTVIAPVHRLYPKNNKFYCVEHK